MSFSIRRNSKEFKAVIANAKNIVARSLENCFAGQSVEKFNDWDLAHGKLTRGNDKFTLHVHGNFWYEFTN